MALQFDGTGTYIDCGTDPLLLGDVFTVMAWVYRVAGDDNPLISFADAALPGIYTHKSSERPLIYFRSTNYRYFNNAPPVGEWSRVAFCVAGNLAADIDNSQYFLNGVEQSATSTNNTDNGLSKSKFQIGRSNTYSGDTIAEVSYWNRVLTQAEIAYYKDRKLTGGEQGLIGYWPMNDAGTGTSVIIKDLARGSEETLLDGCEEANWNPQGAALSETLDFVDFIQGLSSVNGGKDGSATWALWDKALAASYDGTNQDGLVGFFIKNKNDLRATGNAIRIDIGNNAANTFKVYTTKAELMDIVNDGGSGWNTIGGALPTIWATTGSPDITVLNYLAVTIFTTNAGDLITLGDVGWDNFHLVLDKGVHNGTMNGFAGNPWRGGPPIILGRAA